MRIVPVPDTALKLLTQLQNEAPEGQVYVFVNPKGPHKGDRMKRQNTWRDFHVICNLAGISNCSLHPLRKSYCTTLAEALPIHVVQEFAGHSDIRTTRQYYLKVRPQFMEAAKRILATVTQTQVSEKDPD